MKGNPMKPRMFVALISALVMIPGGVIAAQNITKLRTVQSGL